MKNKVSKILGILFIFLVSTFTFKDLLFAEDIENYQFEFNGNLSVTNNVITILDEDDITPLGTMNIYIPGETNTPVSVSMSNNKAVTSSIPNGSPVTIQIVQSPGKLICETRVDGMQETANGDGQLNFNDKTFSKDHIQVDVSLASVCNGPGGQPPVVEDYVLKVGNTVVLDKVNNITVQSGTNWSLGTTPHGKKLNITGEVDPITITGNGLILDIAGNTNSKIKANSDGYSVVATNVGFTGTVNLAGGIKVSQGTLLGFQDATLNIGTSTTPSTKGIEFNGLMEVWFSTVNVYSTGSILKGITELSTVSGGKFTGTTTGTAIDNSAGSTIKVTNGGQVEINYGTLSNGTVTPKAEYIPYSNNLNTNTKTLVTAVSGTNTTAKYVYSNTNNKFSLKSTGEGLYSISWNLDGAEDSAVENGRLDIVAGNGFRYEAEEGDTSATYSIEAGTTVTVILLPDYGYQFKSGGINGGTLDPTVGTKGEYSFVMPKNHLHLSALFEKTEDIITVEAENIEDAKITMPESELEDLHGNLKFEVENSDAAPNSFKVEDLEDYEVGTVLDLSLNEVVLKNGNASTTWTTPITELDDEMEVTLELSEELQGKMNYTIVRDHNGTKTILSNEDVSYDTKTGEITFETDQYSDYAILYQEPEHYVLEDENFTVIFDDVEGTNWIPRVFDFSDPEVIASILEENNITREEFDAAINRVKTATKDNGTYLGIFGLDIYDQDVVGHYKTDGPITYKFKMTDEMKKYNTFKFTYISFNSDLTIDELSDPIEAKVEGDYLVVTLPHLSEYVLNASYVIPPKTNDNIVIYVTLLSLTILSLGILIKLKRTK